MLRLTIEGDEVFHEEDSSFETFDSLVIELEHSLIAISKWESKYQKPFLTPGKKTGEEIFGYIKAMVISPDLDLDVIYRLSQKDVDTIQEYIDSSQSATTFGIMPERRGPGEIITSELIYYWMVAFQIPFECERWHINRLFSLIKVCNIKNAKPRKMSRNEIAMRNRELNEKRRKELNTSG